MARDARAGMAGGVTSVSLSVIVIGLNEAANLSRCFGSVLRALARAGAAVTANELIFVDAGSTDESPVIGRSTADRVIVFEARASAAAARQAGVEHTRAEVLLFLDGDMELDDTWLPVALELMSREERAAGITGMRRDVATGSAAVNENVYGVRSLRRAPHFGGAVLLRRAPLVQVGGFDGALPNGEEPDLYARLLDAGYYVLEAPLPFITHHLKQVPRAAERIARAWDTRGFWRSCGSAVRKKYFAGFVRVYPRFFVSSGVHLAAIGAALASDWLAGVAIEAVALAGFAARGHARELPLAVIRWLSLPVHLPWLTGRRSLQVPAHQEAAGAARQAGG